MTQITKWILFITVSLSLFVTAVASKNNHSSSLHSHHGVKVASFKFEYVKTELILALFIVLIGLFKLSRLMLKY